MKCRYGWLLNIWWLVLCLVFILPFLPIELQVGPTGLNRYFIIIISCFIVLIKGKCVRVMNKLNFVYIFAGIMLVPLAANGDIYHIIFMFTDILLPLYIGFALADSETKLYSLVRTLIISGTILGIMGVFEAFTGINIMDELYNFETIRYAANDFRLGIARTYTSFGTSINFCVYLNILQVLCLFMIFGKKKTIYYAPYCILLLTSFLTISRGPIVISILIQIYLFKKVGFFSKISFYYIAFLAVAISIFIIWFLNIDIFRIMNGLVAAIGVVFNPEKYGEVADKLGMGGSNERVQLFAWVYDSVKDRIVIGNGYAKGFIVQVNQWKFKTSIENYYLAIFNACGLLGLLATYVLYSGLIKNLRPYNIWKNNNIDKGSFLFYAFSAALIFFATILTVSIQDEGRIFFIIMGAALAYKFKGLGKKDET